MPIPEPQAGESPDEFVSRCMGDPVMQEYPEDQRQAICLSKSRGETIEALGHVAYHRLTNKEAMMANVCGTCNWAVDDPEHPVEVCPACGAKAFYVPVMHPGDVLPSSGEASKEQQPRTDADRAKAHFDISDQKWDSLTPEERQTYIDKLPARGSAKEGFVVDVHSPKRHPDFIRIYGEFAKYYCKGTPFCKLGEGEYYAWLKDLGLDETKPYGRARESFQFVKDMITRWKEDQENVYYKVLVAFPIVSMNENPYYERDLVAMAHSLVGVHPNMNHLPETRMEGPEYVAAEYEDGAVESVLKVPKSTICPICGGDKPLHQLIDEHKIVNVSLEADSLPFRFTGCALLTSDVLPGIPMARIFALERFMSEALGSPKTLKGKKYKIEVIGMTKKKEQENPDGNMQCPEGQHFNPSTGTCVPDESCPEGQVFDVEQGKCRPIETPEPEGTGVAKGTQAAPDNSTEAEYPWDQCIADMKAQGYSDDQAAASCAAIKNRTVSHAMLYGLAKTRKEAIALVAKKVKEDKLFAYLAGKLVHKPSDLELSDLRLQKAKNEAKILGLNTQLLNTENSLAHVNDELQKSAGRITELQAQVERLDKRIKTNDEEKIADGIEIKQLRRRLEDEGNEHLALKQKHELLQKAHTDLDTKYRDVLSQNLDLSKRLTTTNEQYLASETEKTILEEKNKKAKRLARFIVKTS